MWQATSMSSQNRQQRQTSLSASRGPRQAFPDVFGVTPVQLAASIATAAIVVLHASGKISRDGTLQCGVGLAIAEALGQNALKKRAPAPYGPVCLERAHSPNCYCADCFKWRT